MLLDSFPSSLPSLFFFFNDTATTEIYTLSLHDALPISALLAPMVSERKGEQLELLEDLAAQGFVRVRIDGRIHEMEALPLLDRKSTRLNSSHVEISYAVFCLKKKKKKK